MINHDRGHCQYNTIEYQINRAPHTVRACHYKECQNRSGSTFGLTMVVDKDSFTINGEITSYIRTSDSSQKITSYFFPNVVIQYMENLKSSQI